MSARGDELVTTDEPTVISKSLPDAIMVEDGQGNGRLPNPPCTDESDWSVIFCETDDLFDQFVTAKTGP